jgi:hypothetical protein
MNELNTRHVDVKDGYQRPKDEQIPAETACLNTALMSMRVDYVSQ